MPEEGTQVAPDTQVPPVTQPDPRIAQAQAEAAEARRIAQQLQQQLQATRPTAQPTSADDLNRQFYREPIASTQAIAQEAIRNALATHGASGRETLIQVAMDKARERNPEMFDKYREEIIGRVRQTVEPQFHDNFNVWLSALNMSIGEHFRDEADAIRSQSPKAPAVKVSDGGPALPNGQAPPPTKAENKLSADEKEMAKNLGISEETYIRGKGYYENQDIRAKSSWDEYVTFSSVEKRRQERAKRNAAKNSK